MGSQTLYQIVGPPAPHPFLTPIGVTVCHALEAQYHVYHDSVTDHDAKSRTGTPFLNCVKLSRGGLVSA